MPGDVVVTGATGFLGGYVVAELLRRTPASVHCLVRGSSEAAADRRLRDHLLRHRLTGEEHGRLRVVRGDIGRPRLGLPDAVYEQLSRASSVYHCAASVNLSAEYEQLAPTNIGGTRAVLDLAATGTPATVHHVSSAAVFLDARFVGVAAVDEDTPLRDGMAGEVGYSQTKFDAERLVAASGLPAVVYRPGLILGDGRTGACADSDLAVRALRAAVVTGRAPRTTARVPAAGVDHVAGALVALSLLPDVAGRVFHLVAPEHLAMRDIFERAMDLGYRFVYQPVPAWRATLAAEMAAAEAFVMVALWGMASRILAETPRYELALLRCDATTKALADLGERIPNVDGLLLERMIDHLVATGRIAPA